MNASEKKFQEIVRELERYPSFLHKRAILNELKEICDAIADGRASEFFIRHYGENSHFSGKINSNTVPRIGRAMGQIGPSRSTLNRNPEMMEYIHLREKERTSQPNQFIETPPTKQAIDQALDNIGSWEDQQLLRFAIHEGETAKKELRLLKQQLQNYPSLKITLEELAGRPKPLEATNPRTSPIHFLIQDLVSLVKRLEDEKELQRFLLRNENGRIKEDAAPGKTLVTRTELIALKELTSKHW